MQQRDGDQQTEEAEGRQAEAGQVEDDRERFKHRH